MLDKEKRALGSKLAKEIVLGLILFSLFLVPFVKDIEKERYHFDEAGWITAGMQYSDLLAKRDLSDPAWQENLRKFGWPTPMVAKYIIGYSARKLGPNGPNETFSALLYNFNHDLRWNIVNGNVPDPALRYAAQLPIAILAALTCLFVFYIGRELAGWKIGLLAAILLVSNPTMQASGRVAMTDVPGIFFVTFAVLVMIFLLRAIEQIGRGENGAAFRVRDIVPLGVFTGIAGVAIGLAVSTKLSGIIADIIFISTTVYLILVPAIVGVLAWKNLGHGKGDLDMKLVNRLLIVTLVIVEGIAVAVFIVTNPFLYSDPLDRTSRMLDYWEKEGFLVENIPRPGAVEGIGMDERMRLIAKKITYWTVPIPERFFSIEPVILFIILFGIASLLYRGLDILVKENRLSPWGTAGSIVVIWAALAFVMVLVSLVEDVGYGRERYYLHLAPPISIIVAYSSIEILKIIFKEWNHPYYQAA